MATSSDPRPIFSGEYRHALDEKNRVTIPSRWRSGEKEEYFLFQNPLRPCLTAMPLDVFKSVGEEAKARVEPSKRQDFIRKFYARVVQVAPDKQGRLLITEEQCKQAGLRVGDVMVTGASDRFEIWSPANWNKFQQADQASFEEVAKEVGL